MALAMSAANTMQAAEIMLCTLGLNRLDATVLRPNRFPLEQYMG